MHLDAHLVTKEHVPGYMNIVFDGLSRNVPPEELGLDPFLWYNAEEDEAV